MRSQHAPLPGGGFVEIRRRWMPWRLRKRRVESGEVLDFVSGADDLGGIALGLVMTIAWFLLGGLVLTVALLAGEAILLGLLLIPLFAAARLLRVLPWVIEVVRGDRTLGTVKVRGWRASEERITAIAEAYRRGEDPFQARDHTVGT